ncbi:membrane protein [Salmonella enterica subsp. enterica]|uniref:Membrane protein n=1 Tax=Salmonella enterica I TaxID=59201 RepID=A0A379WGH7_SALET|nr:membrane protein [Salmonella enterica subsp. enterica]
MLPGSNAALSWTKVYSEEMFHGCHNTGVVLLRWQLLSAVLMFLASTLNIRFRKSDYIGLAVISSGLGVVSACWFATGLLGITMMDLAAIWHNIEAVMVETMSQTPPEWPMVLT